MFHIYTSFEKYNTWDNKNIFLNYSFPDFYMFVTYHPSYERRIFAAKKVRNRGKYVAQTSSKTDETRGDLVVFWNSSTRLDSDEKVVGNKFIASLCRRPPVKSLPLGVRVLQTLKFCRHLCNFRLGIPLIWAFSNVDYFTSF